MAEDEKDKTKKYPKRLSHTVPHWVNRRNAVYHIRIRCLKFDQRDLTFPDVAEALLESVHLYSDLGRWWARIFVLMPDHLHALLSFDPDRRLSRVVGDWKKWHAENLGIRWQENFFDHRIRRDESLVEKNHYIRMNPQRGGLCEDAFEWPWWTASEEELRYPRD